MEPFRLCIQNGKAYCILPSYMKLMVSSHATDGLLTDVLRKNGISKGVLVSDCMELPVILIASYEKDIKAAA